MCIATGPAVGGVAVALLPECVGREVRWWESGGAVASGWGPAQRTLRADFMLSDRPFVFDDAAGAGPTALVPLTLESYDRLVRPRFGGPPFSDQAALESWFLNRYQLTA